MKRQSAADRCKSANTWGVFIERHPIFESGPLQMKYDHLYFFKNESDAVKFVSEYSANNKFIVSNEGEFKEAA